MYKSLSFIVCLNKSKELLFKISSTLFQTGEQGRCCYVLVSRQLWFLTPTKKYVVSMRYVHFNNRFIDLKVNSQKNPYN